MFFLIFTNNFRMHLWHSLSILVYPLHFLFKKYNTFVKIRERFYKWSYLLFAILSTNTASDIHYLYKPYIRRFMQYVFTPISIGFLSPYFLYFNRIYLNRLLISICLLFIVPILISSYRQ